MDYFTFLGLGNLTTGYEEIIYSPNDKSILSKFVQEAVYAKHSDDIKRMIVFCTPESKKRYRSELEDAFEVNYKFKNIEFVEIDRKISSEDFIALLTSNIKAKQTIIDVTHCFRNIPMKLLLTLKYVEKFCATTIEHLYYGRLDSDGVTAYLEDAVNDYNLQDLAFALELFDKTLFLSSDTITKAGKKDKLLDNLIQKMDALNRNFETCNLENSVKCCKEVYNACKSIEKKPDEYRAIIPLLKGIMNKFERLHSLSNETEMNNEMIRILKNHQKMQAGITFTDQTFRKQLVKLSVQDARSLLNNSDDLYSVSQYLISKGGYGAYDNRAENGARNIEVAKKYGVTIVPKAKTLLEDNKIAYHFIRDIRNKVNHGSSVEIKDAEASIMDMIGLIEKLNDIQRN